MQKIKDFIYFFIWTITWTAIGSDLGLVSQRSHWDKYIIAFIAGLLNAFYLGPLGRKRKALAKMEHATK